MPQGGAFKVELEGRRILLQAMLDGQPVRAILDTGAGTSAILRGAAERLHLPLRTVDGLNVSGVGGRAQTMSTRVDVTYGGVTVRHAQMLVVGGSHGIDVDMVLGQDLLADYDLEIDLAHRLVRRERASTAATTTWPTGRRAIRSRRSRARRPSASS